MEILKDFVKQFYSIPIILGCVLFVIGVFFPSEVSGKQGIFVEIGNVFTPVISGKEIMSDGVHYIDSFISTYVPFVKYQAGVQMAGSYISFKEQFEVTKADGTVVSGSVEDEFAIYLQDIKNQAGQSVLLLLSAEEIEALEEIPAPFVYDKEQDILCCFESGIYTAYVKVYGINGGQKTYTFQLPIEN